MNNKKRHFYMNAAEVMDKTIEVFKKSFFIQIAYNFIVSMISSIIMFVAVFVGMILFVVAGISGALSSFSWGGVIFLIVLAVFVFMMLMALQSIGNILLSNEVFKGKKPNLGKTIGTAIKKLPAIFTVLVAQAIFFLPFLGVIALIVYGYVMAVASRDFTYISTARVILWIGFTTLNVAVIGMLLAIFYALTILAIPVCMFDKKYFFGAIFRSIELVKKDFFRFLGTIVLWQITILIFSSSLSAVLTLAQSILGIFMSNQTAAIISVALMGINYLITMVLGVIVAPLSGIFTNVMYINRKIKCEGYDITLYLENEV